MSRVDTGTNYILNTLVVCVLLGLLLAPEPPLMITLVLAHFIADWRFQSHWMSINKSKRAEVLAVHVLAYTAGLGVVVFAAMWYRVSWADFRDFLLLNCLLHFCTDWLTSRATSRLWFFEPVTIELEGKKAQTWFHPNGVHPHWFFEMIGFDQLIHYVTLFMTADWLLR